MNLISLLGCYLRKQVLKIADIGIHRVWSEPVIAAHSVPFERHYFKCKMILYSGEIDRPRTIFWQERYTHITTCGHYLYATLFYISKNRF